MVRIRGEEQPGFLEVLQNWLPQQPWYPARAGRGRPELTRVGGLRLPAPVGDADKNIYLELHLIDIAHSSRHDLVCVPLALRSRPSARAGKNALIGKLGTSDTQEIWLYDGVRDQAFLASWLEMARRRQGSRNGRAHGYAYAGFEERPAFTARLQRTVSEDRRRPISRVVVTPEELGEDSVPVEKVLVEFMRRPSSTRRPSLDTALMLTQTGSVTIARLLGSISGAWEDIEAYPFPEDSTETEWKTGDLAIIREAAGEAPSAWALAKEKLRTGQAFDEDAHALGRTLGNFHADLAAAFGAHPQTAEKLEQASSGSERSLKEQWGRSRTHFDEDERADLSEVVDMLTMELQETEEPLQLQQIHGRFGFQHLHWAAGNHWVVDEDPGHDDAGAPHDLPLRDIVSALISLANLVMEVSRENVEAAEGLKDKIRPVNYGQWFEDVSKAFLKGYRESDIDSSRIVDTVFFRVAMLTEALALFEQWEGQWVFRPSLLLQVEP